MITKADRAVLYRLWESEDLDDNEWREHLNEEQANLVLLWDLVRRDQEDQDARDWWASRAREEARA